MLSLPGPRRSDCSHYQKLQPSSNGLEFDLSHDPVAAFLKKTKFPNLPEVSRLIIDHAKAVAISVARDLNISLRFLAFDGSCSVARDQAIPGSDLDDLTAVVECCDIKRTASWWDKLRFRDVHGDLLSAEQAAALEFTARFKAGLDHHIVGRDQSINVIGLSNLEEALTEPYDPDNLPEAIFIIGDILKLQQQGRIITDSMDRLSARDASSPLLGRYDEFLEVTKAPAVYIPIKFKVNARLQLVKLFSALTTAEKIVLIDIMQSDITNAKQPSVLRAHPDNPALPTLRALEAKGLLFFFDLSNPMISRAVSIASSRGGYLEQTYFQLLGQPRYLAPWKLSNTDNSILAEYFEPDAMRELDTMLRELESPGMLPNSLKAWWCNIHDASYREWAKAAAKKLVQRAANENIGF